MPPLPDVIGPYRVLERLDRPGQGELFLCHDPDLHRLVSVRLFAKMADSRRDDFLAQVRRAAALSHPGLVRVLGGDIHDGAPFVVSEHVEGDTLAELMARHDVLPVGRKLSLLRDVCLAVTYARERRVTIFEIAPAGLCVDRDRLRIKVAGIYAPFDPAGESFGSGPDHLAGLRYWSPEQLAAQPLDERSDVFAAGVVLYELVEGRHPFPAADEATGLVRILRGAPDPPVRAAALGHGLDLLLTRALANDRGERHSSLAALAHDLELVVTRQFPGAPTARDVYPASPSTSVRHRPTTFPKQPSGVTAPGVTVGFPTPSDDGSSTPDEPTHRDKPTPPVLDENVQFTVFRPRALQPSVWQTMLVFAHLSEARPDAADEPDPIEEVQRQAHAVLSDVSSYRQQTVDSHHAVPREGELAFVPRAEGIEFNPPARVFRWTESVHREEFRLRANRTLDGQVVRGRLSVFLGSIILAEVVLAIKVDARAGDNPAATVRDQAAPYRRIFASYSHDDRDIVDEYAAYARSIGDRYLQDVIDLRGGEHWQPGIEALIQQADVFQLFWSWHALGSPYVRQEWEYALSLRRPSFVRPVYWDEPLPVHGDLPPERLRALHFQRIQPRRSVVAPPPAAMAASPATRPAAPAAVAPASRRVPDQADRDEERTNALGGPAWTSEVPGVRAAAGSPTSVDSERASREAAARPGEAPTEESTVIAYGPPPTDTWIGAPPLPPDDIDGPALPSAGTAVTSRRWLTSSAVAMAMIATVVVLMLPVSVRENAPSQPVTIAPVPVPAPGPAVAASAELVVTVYDASRATVRSAIVELRAVASPEVIARAETNAAGEARFELTGGDYEVVVSKAGFRAVSSRWSQATGTGRLEITLRQ